MEFKEAAQGIIEAYKQSIIIGQKLDLEELITSHLKRAYKQGRTDQQSVYKKRKATT